MKKSTLRRFIAGAMSLTLIVGSYAENLQANSACLLTASAAYENTHVNTGNAREDIVQIALTQVGYHEGANNETKYSHWNGRIEGYPAGGFGYAWCHVFVSWCAAQAGISTDVIPKTAGTYTGRSFFVNNGHYQESAANGGSYTPQCGDIIYFGSGSNPSHVGIVTGCDGSTVYTVEGNYNDQVAEASYSLSNSYIIGYGVMDSVPPVPPVNNLEQYLFSADFYYTAYDDLREAFGYNPAALYDHWINHGISEGRCASIFLDLDVYLNQNSDLKAAFGDDYTAAYRHFLEYGCNELGRVLSPVYQGSYYQEHNPDLAGLSAEELLIHFITFGCHEGRKAHPAFDPAFYRYAPGNEDLDAAFGDDWSAYYAHYIEYSLLHGENRPAVGAIRSVKISNVSSEGYTVTIQVCRGDVSYRIAVPAWTQPEGQSDPQSQDDLIGNWENVCVAKKTGADTYTYQVKTKDHKNESGRYATDIYVFEGNNILERYCIETGKRTYVNVPAPAVTTTTTKATTTTAKATTTTAKPTTTTTKATTTTAKPTTTTTTATTTTAKASITTTAAAPVLKQPEQLTLYNGDAYQLGLSAADWTFSSNDESVAAVSLSGTVCAVGIGSAVITAVNKNGEEPVRIQISVLPPVKILFGDTNSDSAVTVADAVLLSRVIAEDASAVIDDAGRRAADVNADGALDGEDVGMILRAIAGLLKL